MKAKELAEMLLAYPEFEVKFGLFEEDGSDFGACLRTFKVMIDDVGYSSKTVRLGAEKEYLIDYSKNDKNNHGA